MSIGLKGIGLAALAAFGASTFAPQAMAEEAQIDRTRIVLAGSSTVAPFAMILTQDFNARTPFTATYDSRGTGGGFRFFCGGIGSNYSDFAGASRPIKPQELEQCQQHGVTEIAELNFGYDGVSLAVSAKHAPVMMTRSQLYLALAEKVPVNGRLVPNPNKTWCDIHPSLPSEKIRVLGPPKSSGTRDSFVELVLEKGCAELEYFKNADSAQISAQCGAIRTDGVYQEVGENDLTAVTLLKRDPSLMGIMGYAFIEENAEDLQAVGIDGVVPTAETIADGRYKLSRPLYLYAKLQHVGQTAGMPDLLATLADEKMIGPEGALVKHGLVPLPAEDRDALRAEVRALKPSSF